MNEKLLNFMYSDRYRAEKGRLQKKVASDGEKPKWETLCNFAPCIIREITQDDGVEKKTRIALVGLHESGREPPEIEIDAAELAAFNWLPNLWGMDCILEVGKGTKEHVRYAAQTTARHAEHQTVYTVTGWRKIGGWWVFLLPGNEEYTASLSNKMRGYGMAEEASGLGLAILTRLLTAGPVTEIILFPLLALVFLSPLNHFLKLANCEPKFVLFLIGRTGTRKSSLAALMLSFFGSFTATDLPMSFQDTSNSIAYNSFALKDVLTYIDDPEEQRRRMEARQAAENAGALLALAILLTERVLRCRDSQAEEAPLRQPKQEPNSQAEKEVMAHPNELFDDNLFDFSMF